MKQFHALKHSLMAAFMLFAAVSTKAVSTGTYTVGTGGNFPDLASALADLNSSALTGPVVFNILPGTYSGTQWQGVLNNVTNASATNRIIIQSQSAVPGSVIINFSGTSSIPAIFRLNNTTNITIRNLVLNNTGTSYGSAILLQGTAADDSIVGCTMTTPVTSSNSTNMALIQAGTSALPLTGRNIVINGNTFTNGSAAVWIIGGSTTTTDDDIIDNNTITNPAYYGIYNSYSGNIKIRNNVLNSTSNMNTVLYNNYTAGGMTVTGNVFNVNCTSGSTFGIYNSYVNSSSTVPGDAVISNNSISITVTTGSPTSLYNTNCASLDMTGNTFITKATSSGSVNPPTVLYNCSNSTLTNNTFRNLATTGGICKNTYYFAYNCSNSVFSYNTVFDSTTSGSLYSSASMYWAYQANGFRCDHNNLRRVSSAGGAWGSTNSATYGYYGAQNCTFNADTVVIATSNTSTAYQGVFLGYYNCYNGTNMQIDSNVISLNSLGSTNIYSLFGYAYSFYSGTNISVSRNYFNFNITAGLGTCYGLGYYLGYSVTNFRFNDNVTNINGGSSGTLYACGMYAIYSANGCSYRNNTWKTNGTTGLSLYTFYYYMGYSGSSDTIENNTLNLATTTGSIYHYNYYAGNGALIRDNDFNYTTTSGSVYTSGSYYPYGAVFLNNRWKATTGTGTIYGLYDYGGGSTTYSGNSYIGNNWDLKSTSGTVYGYYGAYYNNGTKLISNVMSLKTSGTSYLFYNTYGYTGDVKFLNNTFHSNATGATNRMIAQSGSSTSYPGKLHLYNNIFSRSNTVTSGNDIAVGDTAYFISDYNLVYSPGTVTMNATNPAITTTSLASWRAGTGRDRNSLYGDPGYTDAANGNFLPAASNPNSWNASGRGIHMPGDTLDVSGAPRPKTRFDGVPDLGAYEFTPSSTPADATANPATPAINTRQTFLVGGDTAFAIQWGSVVPASISVKQYTGVQAGPMPYPGVGRTYNYVKVTAANGVYDFLPKFYYKDPQLGDISSETNAKIARSANGGTWMGFNYTNALTDSIDNVLYPASNFDSLGSFTGVENARIGIRCVVTPSGLANSGITASSATETWSAEFSPIGYQVAFDSVKMSNPALSNTLRFTNTNSITLGAYPLDPANRLQEFTKYYVYVRTICGAKDTSGWAIDSFVTIISCHTPVPQVTSVTGTQAVIYWDSVRTVGSYEVLLDQSPSDPATGLPWTTSTFLSQSLQPGNTYYFHIRAHCNTIYTNSDWGTVSFSTWTTGIGDLQKNGMVLFPNPVKNTLSVKLSRQPDGEADITITDVTGKEMYKNSISNIEAELNLSALPAGIYNLRYTDRSGTTVTKITKD